MATRGKYVPVQATPAAPEGPSTTEMVTRTLGGLVPRVGGPMGGALGGAALGTAILPGPGTVIGGVLGGALGGAAGEAAAEKFIDPGDGSLNPKKIGVAGAIGAVPGSWLAVPGRVLQSMVRGGLIGGASTAMNKMADDVPASKALNPMSDAWSWTDLALGPVAGGGLGAFFGKFRGHSKPTTPEPSPTPQIRLGGQGKKVFTVPNSVEGVTPRTIKPEDIVLLPSEKAEVGKFETEAKAQARKRVSETKKDISLSAQDTRPSTTSTRGPMRPVEKVHINEQPGARFAVADPTLAEGADLGPGSAFPTAPGEESVSEATQAALSTPANKRILSTQIAQKRSQANQMAGREANADLQDMRTNLGGTSETQIQNSLNRQAAADHLLEAQNSEQALRDRAAQIRQIEQASRGNYEGVVRPQVELDKAARKMAGAHEAAIAENARRTNQTVEQALAEKQAGEIESLRAQMSQEVPPTSMSETISGPGEHGGKARATFRRQIPQEEGGEGGDLGPQPGDEPKELHWTAAQARKEADQFGGPEKFQVVKTKQGQFRLVPKAEEPTTNIDIDQPVPTSGWRALPGTPKPKGASAGVGSAITQAENRERPFFQLDPEERKGIISIIRDKINSGKLQKGPHLEGLGDQLAERLLSLKEGRAHAEAAQSLPGQLVAALKKGGQIYDDKSEEIKRLRDLMGRSSERLFTQNKARGRSADKAFTDLQRISKETGAFPQISGATKFDDLLQILEKEVRQGKGPSAIDELRDGLHPEWPNESVPSVEVQDFTGGDVPTLDVEPPTGKTPTSSRSAKLEEANSNPATDQMLGVHGDEDYDPVSPAGKPLTPEGIVENGAHPSKGELPAEPDMTVEDFAQALSKEGEKPIAEVPFSLEAQSAPAPKTPEQQGLIDKLNTASKNYGKMKARKASGEQVNELERKAAGIEAQSANKAVVESNPDSDLLGQLDPAAQGKVLSDLVKKFKSESGQAAVPLAFRMASGAAGAGVGAAADDEHPGRGAALGLIGGLAAPSALSLVIKGLRSNPEAIKPEEAQAVKQGFGQTLTEVGKMLPDWQRFSLLMDPINLPINMLVGPWGSSVMGSVERAVADKFNPNSPGVKALKKLMHVFEFAKDAEKYRKSGEVEDLIHKATERAEGMGTAGSERFRRVVEAPGRAMVGGDLAARNLLMAAGFSEEEARRITLTIEPETAWGKKIGAFKKSGLTDEKGKKIQDSPIMNMMLPFYRTQVNQLQGSLERTPGVGLLAERAKLPGNRANLKEMLVKQGLGGAAEFAAFEAGLHAPLSDDPNDQNQKVIRKLLNDFGGQYGAGITMAFMAGQAYRKNGTLASIPKAIGGRLAQGDLPLPTPSPINDTLSMLNQATGEKDVKLPTSFVPTVVNPTSPRSVFAIGKKILEEPAKPGAHPKKVETKSPASKSKRPAYVPVKKKEK